MYTTPDRVKALASKIPEFSSANSRVTADQVSDWIADVGAEIDSVLARLGLTPPVSEPAYFVAWLGKLATEGVAATVLKATFQDTSGPNSEGAWAVYERRYTDGLKALRDGKMTPPALEESGGALPGGNDADPLFTVGAIW